MLASFRAVAAKEFLHVRRDPATRFVFLIPVLQLLLFGFAIRVEVTDIPTAVVDLDGTHESRELVDLYANARTFEVVRRLSSLKELQEDLVAGRSKIGVLVPPGFGRDVRRGDRAEALVLVDGSYSSEASAAVQVTKALGFYVAQRFRASAWDVRDLPRLPPETPLAQVDLRTRLLFNPQLRSANFFVPGLVGIILQLVTILLTSFAIVRERESGTWEQVMVTPIGSWGLLFGKLAPYAVVGALETVVVVVLMVHLFGVPIMGSLGLLAALSALFLITSLSLGLILSTFAHNQAEAIQMSFFVLLPSILLSGFVFPLESIPEEVYPLTYLIPVRYFIEILRGIILRGAAFDALWTQAAALGIYTLVLLAIGGLRFRRRVT